MSNYNVALTLPTFDLSVVICFRSAHEAALVHNCVYGRVSGARLPAIEWIDGPTAAGPVEISLSVEDSGDELLVQWDGAVHTGWYKVDKAGFHWDFSKVFTAVALPRIVLGNVVPFHAATVITGASAVLLPGVSGAGKSSVAFAAIEHGLRVAASELSFVRDGELVAGNAQMTIDRRALERYRVETPPAAMEVDGRIVLDTALQTEPLRLSRLMFPRVSDAPLVVRNMSARRARMLLFENAITQLPIGQLVAHETSPLGISPSTQELQIIARQIELLSRLDPVILEGTPKEVVSHITAVAHGAGT